jgi:hypothetical protein
MAPTLNLHPRNIVIAEIAGTVNNGRVVSASEETGHA